MGTLDEAFAQADEQLNNEQPEQVEEVQEETPKEVETEATEPAETTEDKVESFTKFNPNELPEELKAVYKSMQADYTRKTQEIAELQRKASERQTQPAEQRPLTPEEQLNQAVDQRIEQKKTEEFRTTAIKDYESADPRLKLDSDTYDKPTDLFVGQEMDQLLREHVQSGKPEYSFDYQSALKNVLSEWDNYVQSKNKEFLARQQAEAKDKSKKIAKSNPRGKTMEAKPRVKSLDEAIALATK